MSNSACRCCPAPSSRTSGRTPAFPVYFSSSPPCNPSDEAGKRILCGRSIHRSLWSFFDSPASIGLHVTLVRDNVKRAAGLDGHCAGSEWVDDSSLAVLPVPVVAFFVPHFDLHKISSEPYLNRCGASTRVVNRNMSVNKTACIPAGVTRIIILGVWQWCPRMRPGRRMFWRTDHGQRNCRRTIIQNDNRSHHYLTRGNSTRR